MGVFNSLVYGCLGVLMYECMGVLMYECMGVLGVWVFWCMGVWVYGYIISISKLTSKNICFRNKNDAMWSIFTFKLPSKCTCLIKRRGLYI